MHHHWLSVLSILSTVLLAHLATSPARWGDIRVMHTWVTVPANWESLGPPPSGTTIDLYIALKPHYEDALIDALYEVSDPGHQKYGAHLTKEQVAELVAPHQDTLEIVHSWLGHHGVPSSSISTSHGGGWLTITGVPVSQADELLCSSYQLYRRTGTDETGAILRTVGYGLPAALHAHVQTVAPTTHFASPRTPSQTLRKHPSEEAAVVVNATSGELVRILSPPGRDGIVTPSFLRWLYHTEAYVPDAMDKNALGTLGFLDDYPTQADLTQFMSSFFTNAQSATFTVVQVNGGGYDTTNPGKDGSIQTQYSQAMTYPTPYIFYSTGGNLRWLFEKNRPASGDAYLEWLKYLIDHPNIPPTISISYADPEPELPAAYAQALCRLFSQLGARGVTILVASGDDGVGRGDCTDSHGIVSFIPMFPASCPWVTSVGGTTGFYPEDAASLSGGGFSLHFQRPKYQDAAVFTFLKSPDIGHASSYYAGGRGIPDIAAQAQRFVFVRNTETYLMSGTICATSTVAGIVSLLNDYLLSTGRAPLGFLNLLLYDHRSAINDITTGSNPGCNTDGFRATVGWDPVTGLGTLDFQILQHVLDHYRDDDED